MDTSLPRELTHAECVHLLSAGVVGRVAMSAPDGPRIMPVNYSMHAVAIVFRTSPYSEMSSLGWDSELAFEVDELDYGTLQGSSVVARGRGRVVEDPDEIADIRAGWEPRPWAGGSRGVYVKLPWRELTGRRVGDGWPARSPAAYHPLH
jgi:nitroimidazol reductase NimA-like FMN-containing flavoprotein (pyridoxamine 5'-phosphate oxidase superfamily)